MSTEVMESYIRQTIEAHSVPEITIAWQGGEPTLMGLDFYRLAVETAERYRKPSVTIRHTIQTNGTLLDDEWCEFLRENRFLVGISLDGPREMHNAYRRDKAGQGTFDRVVKAARLMQRHKVDFNVLCAVHAANSENPLAVYRFLRDELEARYYQFLPIVERVNGDQVTERSVTPESYGRFLIGIFNEWVRRDVGRVYVQLFDAMLASRVLGQSSLCMFCETCGVAPVVEHNGDLYSCDHFVEPKHLLGNILRTPLAELLNSDRQLSFGENKRDTLPRLCRECAFCLNAGESAPRTVFLRRPTARAD